MSKATYPLKLPQSVKAAAARLAKEDGVSLNQWIASVVAEMVGAVETAAAFLKRRAGKAKPSDLLWFLDRAPKKAPAQGDEVGWELRQRRLGRLAHTLGQFFAIFRSHLCPPRPRHARFAIAPPV